MMTADPAALIDAICGGDPRTVAAAIQAAASRRNELAPVLLARLMQAVAQPRLWDGADGHPSPVFLPYLAAAWKLTAAHPLIIALLRLPPEDCDAVLGDFITEGARLTLADTWPGNLRAVEALAFDDAAEPFARGAALNAAALLAARAVIPRAEALELLRCGAQLSLDAERSADCEFAGQIVSAALDLKAWELRGTVTDLFERELVDPFFCGDLEEVLDELPAGAVFQSDDHSFPPPITDAWEAVRHWHFFGGVFPGRKARASRRSVAESRPDAPQTSPVPEWMEPHPYRREEPKVGRNDPCPCGSGKKFKKCCGA